MTVKKSLLALLLAFVLVFSITVPVSAAGKGKNLLKTVFSVLSGDAGADESLVGTLIKKAVKAVVEKAGDENSPVSRLVRNLLSKVPLRDGKLDFNALGSMVGSLFTGEGAGSDDDYGEYVESGMYADAQARVAAIRAYAAEASRDLLEDGDVRIVSVWSLAEADAGDGKTLVLAWTGVMNYTVEGSDLKQKNYYGNVILATVARGEDGAFSVEAAEEAEEGEPFVDSIAAMCEKCGITLDTYYSTIIYRNWGELLDMSAFLDGHPEYERIECQGELMTKEELDEAADAELADVVGQISVTGE